jgi:hypothetical protein
MRRLVFCASAALVLVLLLVLSRGDLPDGVPGLLVKSQADTASGSASIRGETMLAARYHLRNRTNQFFERAKQPRGYAPLGPAPRKYGTGQTAVPRPPQACPHNPPHPAPEVRGDRVVHEK